MSTETAFEELDFADLIDERTRQFTGREWVLKAVDAWLRDASGPPVFMLTGRPGTGKTAIAARIVQMHLGEIVTASLARLSRDFLAYFHFCQAGLDSTLSPLTFVQSLSQALANRYQKYREALEQQGSQQFVISPIVTVHGPVAAHAQVVGANIHAIRIEILSGDARPLFDQMVRRPLRALCNADPPESIVVLVDSLDEAVSFNPEVNIAQLLGLVQDFPRQVRFLVTSRSNEQRVFNLVGQPTIDLIANAPPGLDEVRDYAAARLNEVPEPSRSSAATRIAEKSKGNFLYAYHVLNDLILRGANIVDADTRDLPDQLEDVYRIFIERGLASNQTRWNDVYRPLIGSIAVARGEGLTKSQLVGITGLAEDTATDVLKTLGQYLVGGEAQTPYRIYHQSFRDFLLSDTQFTVFPADRHAAIARYFQDRFGANWGTCNDVYALRYTPIHWAEAATISEHQRTTRTQALVELAGNAKYQRRFERSIANLPELHEHLHRAVQVAALNEQDEMLPWIIKAAQNYVAFRREYLQADTIVKLADEGALEQAEARLRLFPDIDEDWRTAARLILAWLGAGRNRDGAEQLRALVPDNSTAAEPLRWLSNRLALALGHKSSLVPAPGNAQSLKVAQELVKRIGGQAFDREFLLSINPSLIASGSLGPYTEMIGQRGYAAAFDAPILVNVAWKHGIEGTALVDRYIDAHAGYNYVEYRNRSLWFVLQAVLRHHPEQDWVKQRLRRILVAALTGGGVEFRETLPLTALLLHEKATKADAPQALEYWRSIAIRAADELHGVLGADDTWGNHKRRLTGLMELY
jgi:NACHT domain